MLREARALLQTASPKLLTVILKKTKGGMDIKNRYCVVR